MTLDFFLSCFLLYIPTFNKAINYWESFVLYGGIVTLYLYSFFYPSSKKIHPKFILWEMILVILSIISTIFSQNIGYSYYGLFYFIFSLVLVNLCLSYLDTTKIFLYIVPFSVLYSLILILNKIHFITLTVDPNLDNFILQNWGHSYLADLLIFPIIYIIYELLNLKIISKNKKYLYIFISVFLLITLLLTNSRSAIVAISLSFLFLFLPKINQKIRPLFIISLLFLVIFICFQIFVQNPEHKSLDGSRLEFWHQALVAFTKNPLTGQGPFNFFYINRKYQSVPNTNSNYAHNSFLEYLCLNGLPFTLIIFSGIFYSLYYQYKNHHQLNFILGFAAIINSFLDPSWSSFGIFCLSFFFIFSHNSQILLPSSKTHQNHFLKILTFVIIFVFFISKTSSDYLFISGQNQKSLSLDPFNLNARLALLPNNLSSTIFLYKNDFRLYQQLITDTSLPQSESYYYQLFSLVPYENETEYKKLMNYYLETKSYDQFIKLISLYSQQFVSGSLSSSTLKTIYQAATNLYPTDPKKSIILFKLLVKYYPDEGHFQIDLANAYWHHQEKTLALDTLNSCLSNPSAHNQCQEYLNHQQFNLPGETDFLDYINHQF